MRHDVFPPVVLEDAKRLDIPPAELERRPLEFGISVDSCDPHEIDDAFSAWETPDGYEAAVSIADVTALFPCDGSIDLEAQRRGRSLYGTDEAYIPMLPEPLVELASLTPGDSRLALTVIMTFDRSGRKLGTEVRETVFVNHQALDFREAGKIAQGHCTNDPLVDESLRCGGEIARLLRSRRNALLPEGFGPLDNGGPHELARPLSREEASGALIIQELMIATNTAIAEFMDGKISLLFRCHKLRNGELNREEIRTKLQNLSDAGETEEIARQIGDWFERAAYSAKNEGHAGLNEKYYTHATSPLRRYADMVNHRLLRILLRGVSFSDEEQAEINQYLDPIAKAISVDSRWAERIFIELTGGIDDAVSAAAHLIQSAFDDPARMPSIRERFARCDKNGQYVETLRQLCKLSGWELSGWGEPTYIEKKENLANHGGLPIDRWEFTVLINGRHYSAKVRILPNETKELAKNRAAFYFLWDYINGKFGNIAKNHA